MQDLDFNEIVTLIRKEDGRYDRKAYGFVREGLDHTVKQLKKRVSTGDSPAQASRHVDGRELSDGLRIYALDQFGPLAKTVLNEWGLTTSGDFGEIVFNLIEYNVFSKTETDRREDFGNVFDFEQAFVVPFLPKARVVRAGSKPRVKSASA